VEIHLWKVCRQQQCEEQRLLDACDSAWDFLIRRPASLGEYRLDDVLPNEADASRDEWACLSASGFFCHELADDATCLSRYGETCDRLRSWVPRAQEKCLQTRTSDCDKPGVLARQRPLNIEEIARSRKPSRDSWLEKLGALRERDASPEDMERLLDQLPGLDVADAVGMQSCERVGAMPVTPTWSSESAFSLPGF
jgi:hypothetical protein